jgi:hypothetical protein
LPSKNVRGSKSVKLDLIVGGKPGTRDQYKRKKWKLKKIRTKD